MEVGDRREGGHHGGQDGGHEPRGRRGREDGRREGDEDGRRAGGQEDGRDGGTEGRRGGGKEVTAGSFACGRWYPPDRRVPRCIVLATLRLGEEHDENRPGLHTERCFSRTALQ